MPSQTKRRKNTLLASQASAKTADDDLLPPGDMAGMGSSTTESDGKLPAHGLSKSKASNAEAKKAKISKGVQGDCSGETSSKAGDETAKRKNPFGSPAQNSDDSSGEEEMAVDADIFSTESHDSDDEATDELIQRAKKRTKERAKTLRYVEAFLDSHKDKHFIELPVEPLRGVSNFSIWASQIELVLRMHQVWPICEGSILPLDEDHEMFIWYERMVDVALACIYKNVLPSIREEGCFQGNLDDRHPRRMIESLCAHYRSADGHHFDD